MPQFPWNLWTNRRIKDRKNKKRMELVDEYLDHQFLFFSYLSLTIEATLTKS